MGAKERGLSVKCAESGEDGGLPIEVKHTERACGEEGM